MSQKHLIVAGVLLAAFLFLRKPAAAQSQGATPMPKPNLTNV